MTSGAEAYFQAAGQPPPEPADEQPKPQDHPTRDCPICGGNVRLSNNRLEQHNQYVVGYGGTREGTEFCDGSRLRIPTTKEN
jgi:hypothetical protein